MRFPTKANCHSSASRLSFLVLTLFCTGTTAFARPQANHKAVIANSGFALKGITTRPTAMCDEADPKSDKQHPFGAFNFVYILPPDPDGPQREATLTKDGPEGLEVNGMYRVGYSLQGGNSSSDQAGYISAEDVKLWGHIQALQFTKLEGRDPTLFFSSVDLQLQYYTGAEKRMEARAQAEDTLEGAALACERLSLELEELEGGAGSAEELELEVAAAEARLGEAADALTALDNEEREAVSDTAKFQEPPTSDHLVIMPMIEETQGEINGEEMAQYTCAFMAGPADGGITRGTVEASTEDEGGAVAAAYAAATEGVGLDVVFVIDTTMSMQPAIDSVRSAIQSVAKSLKDAELPQLRLGLVGYRDDMDAMEYTSKVFCTLEQGADLNTFLAEVEKLETASNGSDDWAEDVFSGLSMGLDEDKLGWTNNPLQWNLIVLVGDASGHPTSDLKNSTKKDQRSILSMAQPESHAPGTRAPVQFYVQHVLHTETPDDDKAMAETQFLHITESATYPGFFEQTHRSVDFSGRMSEEILRMLKNWKLQIEHAGDIPEAILKASGRAPSVKPDFQVARLIRLKAAATEGEKADGAVAFGEAIAAEMSVDGSRQLITHLFVEKSQLETYVNLLDFLSGMLHKAGEPGKKDVGKMVKQLQGMTAAMNLGEEFDATVGKKMNEVAVSKLLMAMHGVPSQTGIFNYTLTDLAQMAPSDWEAWLDELNKAILTLSTHLDTPSMWWALGDGVNEENHHAYIKISELP